MRLGAQHARRLIAEANLSITGIAEQIGVKRSHLLGCLVGRNAPSERVREQLPEILGVPLEECFSEEMLAKKWTGTRPGRPAVKK